MGYREETFKTAIQKQGYFFEKCNSTEFGTVTNAYGSVRIGNILRQVRWNNLGHCFDRRCNPMPKYNLKQLRYE